MLIYSLSAGNVPLFEGMRVVLTADVRLMCVAPFNRTKSGPWDVDTVPAGTAGTVFRFRTRKGSPTNGLPHPQMWGVAYDGVPPTVGDCYGLADARDLAPAPAQLPARLAALRDAWEAALEGQQAIERRIAAAHAALPPGRYVIAERHLWEELKAATATADQLRQEYDAAAQLPAREV